MSQPLHQCSPVIDSSQNRSGSLGLLSQLWRSANYRRPDTELISLRRRVIHFLRCAPHLDTFSDWFGNPEHQALRQALAQRPSLAMCVVHPYLNTGWSAERRLSVVAEHYALLHGRLGFLRFAPPSAVALANLGEGIQIRLDKPGKFEHEGELTVNLFGGELRLYSLVFTLAQVDSRLTAYAGALQGSCIPDALDIYRTLTHRMHGLRPRDLLVTAFRLLCLHLGVERILAVSDRCRVAANAYFKSSALVFSSYDDAWLENGGRLNPEGFFEMSVQPGQRTADHIPSRKRAQYRRRYAMLDTLSRQLSDGLDQASQAHTTP